MRNSLLLIILVPLLFLAVSSYAFSRPDTIYPVFQFPQNQIPRIDGDFSDWAMVPDSFAIGLDQMKETVVGKGFELDPSDFDIKVKVGWVKDLNRLYFYVEAFDDYWDFENPSIQQDIFELVVDADASGGNFIKKWNANLDLLPVEELHFRGHGAHAQNYHIFMPAENKDWAMVWGNTPWIKNFPFANAAYDYSFKHGEAGTLKMEFYITPFDYAAIEGINRSAVSELKENEIIGLSWCILEYDKDQNGKKEFINLAHDTKMIRSGEFLNAFKLMPLTKDLMPELQAYWSFLEVDRDRRVFAFKDESIGKIEKWNWDFGDGSSSSEQNPVHQYDQAGEWTVILTIENGKDKSVRSKVWDVVTK